MLHYFGHNSFTYFWTRKPNFRSVCGRKLGSFCWKWILTSLKRSVKKKVMKLSGRILWRALNGHFLSDYPSHLPFVWIKSKSKPTLTEIRVFLFEIDRDFWPKKWSFLGLFSPQPFFDDLIFRNFFDKLFLNKRGRESGAPKPRSINHTVTAVMTGGTQMAEGAHFDWWRCVLLLRV